MTGGETPLPNDDVCGRCEHKAYMTKVPKTFEKDVNIRGKLLP